MRLVLVGVLAAALLPAATHVVSVAGLGGEPDYEQRFTSQVQEIEKLLKGSGDDIDVKTLQGAGATKAALRALLEGASKQVKADDTFVLMLIGHGSYDGTDYKFNVPGPDLTSTELAALLDRIPAERQLVVNATSASGASFHALQKPSRTVVTATKSGTERNAPVFARYWIEALRDPAADTDKNEVVSALEAFRFAEQKTKKFYETNNRLATEHPMLNGGDAQASLVAARVALLRLGSVQKAANDPAKRALLVKREELEGQIDSLKLQKAAMPVEQYRKQLQALLLELARTQEELDK